MFETQFIISTAVSLVINLIYTILALIIGIAGLKFVDYKLLKSVDLEDEIKKGNLAAAIFASTILIFVAVIVSFGLKG
ncbi:MAG: DUF350 domain-containing protein [Deltaproteobacteria bacterium]|nr:DUF350 domain-containing protein [Deltaproteobacteria bacterium]